MDLLKSGKVIGYAITLINADGVEPCASYTNNSPPRYFVVGGADRP